MTSAAYNSVKTLQLCAKENEGAFPRAAQVVRDDFYVDDLLTSQESKSDIESLKADLTRLLSQGGFELAKWQSNCESIVTDQVGDKLVQQQDSISILGISWNCRDDEFRFRVKMRPQPVSITKRVISSEAPRIFHDSR